MIIHNYINIKNRDNIYDLLIMQINKNYILHKANSSTQQSIPYLIVLLIFTQFKMIILSYLLFRIKIN